MRARFVVESRRWDLMAHERNFGNINELCAIGFAAARSGNPSLAELARQALAARSQAAEEGDLRPAAAIMERQVAATIAQVAGRGAEALAILRAASDAERQLPPPLGLPIPLKPSAELFGEMLIDAGKPAEAVGAFDDALSRNRNRTLSVLGLARASAALGHSDAARGHYEQLLANLSKADADVAEVAEARTYLATASSAAWISTPLLWTGGAIAGLIAVGLAAYKRRRPVLPEKSTAAGAGSGKRPKARR
jgi:tetratricopeptide (TPR) repeat protein